MTEPLPHGSPSFFIRGKKTLDAILRDASREVAPETLVEQLDG